MSGIIFPNVAGTLAPLMQLNQSDERNALLREESDARKSAAPFIQGALSGDPKAQNELATRHPDTLIKILPLINSMDANKRARVKEDADFITQNGMAILNAPPEAQRQLYDRVRQEAEASGRNVSQWPTQYDSGWVSFHVNMAMPIAEHFRRSGEGVTYGPPTADGKTAPAEWDQHFNAASTTYGIPIPLIKAVAGTESMFNPNAVSPAGAGGVMQIMPGTAADLGVTNRFDIGQSINKGTAYLKQQMDRFGNLDHALVAYNWGPGNAEKWVAAGANPAALPAETRNYITKVKSNLQAQTAQPGGPGVPQGGDPPPAGDGSGIPVQPGQGQPIPHELLKGVELPAGYRIGTQNGKIFSPVPGYVQVMPPGGGAPILWPMPKPKEQGAGMGGPFAGNGMDSQARNALVRGANDPAFAATPEYAAAFNHLGRPHFDAGTGTTIPAEDMSRWRQPTYSAQGQQAPQGGAQQGAAPPPGGLVATPVPGLPPKVTSMTEAQAKAYGFSQRMETANTLLNDLAIQGTSSKGRFLEALPGGLGNYAQSSEYQRFEQAKRNFMNSQLRDESGAVIGTSEFMSADKQYFPQPGQATNKELIAQMAENRRQVVEAMMVKAGLLKRGERYEPPKAAAPAGDGGPPANSADKGRLIFDAQQAIREGREPAGVRAKLKQLGVDPAELDKAN